MTIFEGKFWKMWFWGPRKQFHLSKYLHLHLYIINGKRTYTITYKYPGNHQECEISTDSIRLMKEIVSCESYCNLINDKSLSKISIKPSLIQKLLLFRINLIISFSIQDDIKLIVGGEKEKIEFYLSVRFPDSNCIINISKKEILDMERIIQYGHFDPDQKGENTHP